MQKCLICLIKKRRNDDILASKDNTNNTLPGRVKTKMAFVNIKCEKYFLVELWNTSHYILPFSHSAVTSRDKRLSSHEVFVYCVG